MKVDLKDLLTGAMAAELLGVSQGMIRMWVFRKMLNPIKIPGSVSHLYHRKDLEKLRTRKQVPGRVRGENSKPRNRKPKKQQEIQEEVLTNSN